MVVFEDLLYVFVGVVVEICEMFDIEVVDVGEDDECGVGDVSDVGYDDYLWNDGMVVMGILNVMLNSFYDGGEFYDIDDVVE